MNLFELVFLVFWFSSDRYIGMELLDPMVVIFLNLSNFHAVFYSGCTNSHPINSVQEFLSLSLC